MAHYLLWVAFIYTLLCIVPEAKGFLFSRTKRWTSKVPRNKLNLSRRPKTQGPGRSEKRDIDRELMSISFFSFLHQASLPFSDLIDGAFLSNLDASSLGAMGVARSSQNSVSRLYNSPLSKTTISMIASASGESSREEGKDSLSAAVSTALSLALVAGVLQLFVFTIGGSRILAITGVVPSSSMYAPAMVYMKARAFTAPTAILWLVATNIFRGMGDATTPLVCAVLFNLLNLLGDFLFIKHYSLKIVGSPFATTTAQMIALVPFLVALNAKVPIRFKGNLASIGEYLSRYGKAALFLIGRVVARIAAHAYCSRRSALLGSVAASSYSIMGQIGFWVTIACEGISIGTQSLLSRYITDESDRGSSLSKFIIRRSFQAGLVLAGALSALLYIFRHQVISIFTKSSGIKAAILTAFPSFLLAQASKGLAFPASGTVMGGMDWSVSMWSMGCANLACFGVLRYAGNSTNGLWFAWTAYYLVQGLVGIIRYKSRTGVWRRLR